MRALSRAARLRQFSHGDSRPSVAAWMTAASTSPAPRAGYRFRGQSYRAAFRVIGSPLTVQATTRPTSGPRWGQRWQTATGSGGCT
jgi:hypothetical protein